MFCPNCGAEFRQGFTVCSDCGVELVDALPDRGIGSEGDPADLGDLVPVRQVWEPALLPVLTSALTAESIPFVVQGEHSLYTVGVTQLLRVDPANIYWTILVPEAYVDRAAPLLASQVQNPDDETGDL